MDDYFPLDLSGVYTAGMDLYAASPETPGEARFITGDENPPVGDQSFHGLPFHIGSGNPDAKCFVSLGKSDGFSADPVRVPVGQAFRSLLLAHAVLDSHLLEGGPMGETAATMVVRYAGGENIRVPIRERFEVGSIPLHWGHYPFLCLPDQKQYLMDRYEGRWEQAGGRLAEANQGWPEAYFIWFWPNPHPERRVEALEFHPGNVNYVLAGITLGHLNERPLSRSARRPVKLTIKDEALADKPFDMEVEVDRGVATYPYPLPAVPLAEQPEKTAGFGFELNESSSPVYEGPFLQARDLLHRRLHRLGIPH